MLLFRKQFQYDSNMIWKKLLLIEKPSHSSNGNYQPKPTGQVRLHLFHLPFLPSVWHCMKGHFRTTLGRDIWHPSSVAALHVPPGLCQLRSKPWEPLRNVSEKQKNDGNIYVSSILRCSSQFWMVLKSLLLPPISTIAPGWFWLSRKPKLPRVPQEGGRVQGWELVCWGVRGRSEPPKRKMQTTEYIIPIIYNRITHWLIDYY